jgi:hypothetical protein
LCVEYLYRRFRFLGVLARCLYADGAAGSLQRLQPPDSSRGGPSWNYDLGYLWRWFQSGKVAPTPSKTFDDTFADKSQGAQGTVKQNVVPVLGRFVSTSMQNNWESRDAYLVQNKYVDYSETGGIVGLAIGNVSESVEANNDSKEARDVPISSSGWNAASSYVVSSQLTQYDGDRDDGQFSMLYDGPPHMQESVNPDNS